MGRARVSIIAVGVLWLAQAGAQVGHNTELLNPNLATADELEALPQLDASAVETLVSSRPFSSASEIAAALGAMDEARRNALFGRMFLPLDLNTASREEILLIPGMTPRMAHEFEEYRPYTSLDQFRREIGKYVDEDEVARLEQYVFVPMDLNTATREAFLTIPGMTARMAREFEEYRPYTSLDQFRREIGKYVDADEVARLERYVTIRQ